VMPLAITMVCSSVRRLRSRVPVIAFSGSV
jgi:hypothetical protein